MKKRLHLIVIVLLFVTPSIQAFNDNTALGICGIALGGTFGTFVTWYYAQQAKKIDQHLKTNINEIPGNLLPYWIQRQKRYRTIALISGICTTFAIIAGTVYGISNWKQYHNFEPSSLNETSQKYWIDIMFDPDNELLAYSDYNPDVDFYWDKEWNETDTEDETQDSSDTETQPNITTPHQTRRKERSERPTSMAEGFLKYLCKQLNQDQALNKYALDEPEKVTLEALEATFGQGSARIRVDKYDFERITKHLEDFEMIQQREFERKLGSGRNRIKPTNEDLQMLNQRMDAEEDSDSTDQEPSRLKRAGTKIKIGLKKFKNFFKLRKRKK